MKQTWNIFVTLKKTQNLNRLRLQTEKIWMKTKRNWRQMTQPLDGVTSYYKHKQQYAFAEIFCKVNEVKEWKKTKIGAWSCVTSHEKKKEHILFTFRQRATGKKYDVATTLITLKCKKFLEWNQWSYVSDFNFNSVKITEIYSHLDFSVKAIRPYSYI